MKIKLGNKTYKFHTSLSDLRLRHYQAIMKLETSEVTGLHKLVQLTAILADIPMQEANRIEVNSLQDNVDMIGKLYQMLLTDLQYTTLSTEINIDGKVYGLVPDFKSITTAELFDLDMYAKLGEDSYEYAHRIMAILYRPVTKHKLKRGELMRKLKHWFKIPYYLIRFQSIPVCKLQYDYKIEAYDNETAADRANIFLESMPLDVMYSAMLFFSKLTLICSNRLMNSYLGTIEKEKK